MTQSRGAQWERGKSAWKVRARGRTLAQRRADLEAQVRDYLATSDLMALTDLADVKARLKDLHHELERQVGHRVTQLDIANDLGIPYRTFQSWEGGEVESERASYELLADYYSERLGRPVTANFILFGSDEAPPLERADTLNGMPDALRETLREIPERLAAVEVALEAQAGVLAELAADVAALREGQQREQKRLQHDADAAAKTGE